MRIVGRARQRETIFRGVVFGIVVPVVCCTPLGSRREHAVGAMTSNRSTGVSKSTAVFAARLFLRPKAPYPWHYGDAAPSLLARARAFVPGVRTAWRFAQPPGAPSSPQGRVQVQFAVMDTDGRPRANLGEAIATIHDGAVDGEAVLEIPRDLPDGRYQLVARFDAGDGKTITRTDDVFVGSAYPALRRDADEALARAAAARLDDVEKTISLPSLQMLVEDADIVWNDFVEAGRDWTFVRTQLETAVQWARRLAGGDDPYRQATGVLVKAYRSEIDGTLQPYGVRLPRSYRSDRAWPLVVDLHGAYANHRFDMRRVFGQSNRGNESDHEATRNDLPLPEVDMIVVTAYGRGELSGYAGLGERDVLDVIAAVERAYTIDRDRIYLTGYSMGGEGTWQIGLHYPDLFAAIVPVCAISDPARLVRKEPARGGGWDRALMALASPLTIAENAMNQRVFIYHGAADTTVPVADSRAMVERYRQLGWLGKNVVYDELPGVGHAAWVPAYRDARLFSLLAPIRRPAFPRRVVYRTVSLRYRDAYWVRIDGIARGLTVAELIGEQDGRLFDLRPSNVSAFSLRLDPVQVPPDREITVRVAGKDVYKGTARAVLSFALGDGGWAAASSQGGLSPHGASASYSDRLPARPAIPDHAQPGLFSKSLPRTRAHVYVYGTLGTARITKAAQHLAERLANWGDAAKVRWAVRRDHDVTDGDLERFDLVLIGGARINQLVGRMAGALALADGPDALVGGDVRLTAPDRSYRLVTPNPLAPDRYVLIFGAETDIGLAHLERELLDPTRPAPESNLDYVLWDGDGSVRLAGVFRDQWRIGH
jgi:predicted esterase